MGWYRGIGRRGTPRTGATTISLNIFSMSFATLGVTLASMLVTARGARCFLNFAAHIMFSCLLASVEFPNLRLLRKPDLHWRQLSLWFLFLCTLACVRARATNVTRRISQPNWHLHYNYGLRHLQYVGGDLILQTGCELRAFELPSLTTVGGTLQLDVSAFRC